MITSRGTYSYIIRALRTILIILGVLMLGFLALNQMLGFFYKIHFLKAPCDLCGELNPGVQECIDELNKPRPSFWLEEGWTDPFKENEKIKYNKTPLFNRSG